MVIHRRAPENGEAIKQKEHEITTADAETLARLANALVRPEVPHPSTPQEQDGFLMNEFKNAMNNLASRGSQETEAARVTKLIVAGGLNDTVKAEELYKEALYAKTPEGEPLIDGDTYDALTEVWGATLPGRRPFETDEEAEQTTLQMNQYVDEHVGSNLQNPTSRLLLNALGVGLTYRIPYIAQKHSVAMQQEIEK